MTDYFNKYLKYKTKYSELKSNDIDMIGGGKNNKFILVDGTSSAGKSTICKYFSKKNFLCFQFDNYRNDKRIKFNNIFKNIKNKYGEAEKIYDNEPVKYMVNDAVKTNKNILFDHISQKEIINYMNKIKYNNLYIIIVFTNLNNLARNLEIRRKNGDIRGVFAFKQFSERYIKCKNNDLQKIEVINRKDFYKILLKYFKYEFKNEEELIKFSNDIFSNMNIIDDNDHFIKLRNEYKYDYLLITTNKTKTDIFNELNKIIL
jgi:adenylate kinase family enzyme